MAASIIFKEIEKIKADNEGNISTEKVRVPFYFSLRITGKLPKLLGVSGLVELGEVMQRGDIDDLVKIAWLAHENACFIMQKPLDLPTADDAYHLFTEDYIQDTAAMIMDGLQEMMEVTQKAIGGVQKKSQK